MTPNANELGEIQKYIKSFTGLMQCNREAIELALEVLQGAGIVRESVTATETARALAAMQGSI